MSDEWLKDKLNNIDGKLDKLDQRLDSVDVTLGKQEVSISEHIKRTAIAEENIEILKKDNNMVHGAFKFVGLISTLSGLAYYIIKILSK